MELQVGVKVLLKNKEGKYLLVKRSSEKYPEVKRKWDIVGGRISAGTTLMENLKREIKEEVGLDLEYNPILIAAQDILQSEKHVVRLTYTAVIDGDPILSDEHTEFGWFTIDEMKNIDGLDAYFKEVLEKDL